MTSFELVIDEKSAAGSEFMARVSNEIRRAVATEKSSRRLTQQAIADKIGTSRAVVNREIRGLENLTARRIGELLWAIGWEPVFEARKLPSAPQVNECPYIEQQAGTANTSFSSDGIPAAPGITASAAMAGWLVLTQSKNLEDA